MKIPEGYQTVMPYLLVKDAAKFIEFAKTVFGAEEKLRVPRGETGLIAHAEIVIGDSKIMIADATEQFSATPSGLFIYVSNTDKTYTLALQHGAKSIMEPVNAEYGSRAAGVLDEFGNTWWITTP